jgi:protein SCO1/2
MIRFARNRALTPIVLIAFFSGAAGAALDEKAALRDSQAAIGRAPADHLFRDSEGREVRLSELRGKPLVVSFVYTGCFQVCPTTTKALAVAAAEAESALGPGKFRLATIGFNLPFDTPQAMKQFARQAGISSRDWLFLTPDAGELPKLLADFGFAFEPTSAGFDHLLQASIVDAGGRVYRQLYGDSFAAPQFIGALLELVANEPRAPTDVAGLIEQVKLLCTVYDPLSGRYRVNYAVVAEMIGGGLVILALLAFLIIELRRRRRARPAAG